MKVITKKIFFQVLATFTWLVLLFKTDSYYINYLLIGIVSILGIFKGAKNIKNLTTFIFASLLSLMVCLANYNLFTIFPTTEWFWQFLSVTLFMLTFISGVLVFTNVLSLALKIVSRPYTPKTRTRKDVLKTFLLCFGIMALIEILVFLISYYPGNLTPDSIYQVQQIMTNTYSNHHPFYFTILIKLFISLGLKLNGDINLGIALFNIFQILVLSASFAYAISTLYQKGISRKTSILLSIFLGVLPYNIMYSFTVWKDVLFGASLLVLIVSFCQYFDANTKNQKIAFLILIALSSIIMCLFRSNGFLAFLVTAICFFAIFKKQYLIIGGLMIATIAISFILKKPVLNALNVPQPDTVESLSIPMQQISRTIVEEKDNIDEEDLDILNQIADVDRIASVYNPIIHDPVKDLVRQEGNQSFIKEHLKTVVLLYLKLGLKYPGSYFRAWIDQTRGYYNSGYNYWIWQDTITNNDFGIHKTVASTNIHNFLSSYLNAYYEIPLLNPFISIGIGVWLLVIILYTAIIQKKHFLIFLTIPPIAVTLTLLIATPVFSEFRYAYTIFTCLPFLLVLSLISPNRRQNK